MPAAFDAESRRADRLERPRVRAIPDGDLAGVPHRVRGGGRCAAGADGAGRRAAPAHARSRVPAALEAAGEGDQHPVRGRRGVGDGAVVRAGPAVAPLHGPIRRIDRAAVRARGLRVLHRGDLPRHLSVRARQGVAGPAPSLRRRRRGQRRGVGAVRHAGERVHERTGRPRSARRDGQPVVAVPGRARAALLLPGDRVGDGRDLGVHPAARSPRGHCTARRWRSRCRSRASPRWCSRCRAIVRRSTSPSRSR